jgi:hypothetical protein
MVVVLISLGFVSGPGAAVWGAMAVPPGTAMAATAAVWEASTATASGPTAVKAPAVTPRLQQAVAAAVSVAAAAAVSAEALRSRAAAAVSAAAAAVSVAAREYSVALVPTMAGAAEEQA